MGRYLEHSRIYRFANGDGPGRPCHLIGSADLMPRNLDRRVEVLTPVVDPDLQGRLDEILDVALRDDVLAWTLDDDGRWSRMPPGGEVESHVVLQQLTDRPGVPDGGGLDRLSAERQRPGRSPGPRKCHTPLVTSRPWTQHCSSWAWSSASGPGWRPPWRRPGGCVPAACSAVPPPTPRRGRPSTRRRCGRRSTPRSTRWSRWPGERLGAQAEAGSRELASRSAAFEARLGELRGTMADELAVRNAAVEARMGDVRAELARVAELVGTLQRERAEQHGRVETRLSEMAAVSARLADTTQSLRQALANPGPGASGASAWPTTCCGRPGWSRASATASSRPPPRAPSPTSRSSCRAAGCCTWT